MTRRAGWTWGLVLAGAGIVMVRMVSPAIGGSAGGVLALVGITAALAGLFLVARAIRATS